MEILASKRKEEEQVSTTSEGSSEDRSAGSIRLREVALDNDKAMDFLGYGGRIKHRAKEASGKETSAGKWENQFRARFVSSFSSIISKRIVILLVL